MRLSLFTAALIMGAPLGMATAQVSASNTPPVKAGLTKAVTAPGGQTTPQLVSTFVGGNDSCASAASTDAISGPGSFPVNTAGATSGAPLGTCGFIGNDVWLYWTATSTGATTMTFCGQTTTDTVLAVWANGSPSGSCPTTQLACNDDTCAFQSQVTFNATNGTSYFIECGSYNSGASYSANLVVTVAPPPTTNDDCSIATAIAGPGVYPIDTTAATTTSPTGTCAGIGRDVWFLYTAASTGTVTVNTCGQVSGDSAIAVWADGTPSGSCPTTQIGCVDDFCGLQTSISFCSTAGTKYFFEIGSYAAGPGYIGTFTVGEVPSGGGPAGCTDQDDGTSENSVGLTAGGAVMWMVGFGAGVPSTSISAVSTAYGTPLFPGGYVPQGPVTIAVYDDPNDDGDPTDGVLLSSTTATVAPGSVDTDVFQTINLPSTVTANGLFFVTATVTHNAGEYPGPLDQSSGGGPTCGTGGSNPGSWVCGNTSGTMNFNNLAANDVPPLDMDLIGLPGNWLLRVTCGPGGPPGTAYCFGDGSGTACPCGPGAAGNGCPNSVNAAGANLAASGSAVVGADTLVLTGSGMPATATALYFQGNAQISVVFGDGLRCVATSVVRLGTKTNAGGSSAYPAPGDQPISVRGSCSPGDSRNYQCWYRNAAAFCTAATFNLTNGMNVVWQ